MGALLTILAVSYQVFFSYIALVAVISTIDWPMKIFGILPRELTNQEHFIAAGVALFTFSFLAIIFGNYYFRIKLDARLPSTRERNVFEKVQEHMKAMYEKRFHRNLPPIKWSVVDTRSLTAFAYGRNSISVSRGLLKSTKPGRLTKKEFDILLGVTAHELGHLYYRDTIALTIMLSVSWPFFLYRVIFMPLFALIPYIGLSVSSIFLNIVLLVEGFGWLILGFGNKSREYRADLFSARLVGPHKLIMAFDRLVDREDYKGSSGILEYYVKSHPPTELRRSRLEDLAEDDSIEECANLEWAKVIYLNVPYHEKDDAKILGAQWDKEEGKWYITEDQDRETFARWDNLSSVLKRGCAPKKEKELVN